MPKSDIPWEKIREAYLLGEESTSISARMKADDIIVKPGTIRQRARREGWMTPRNMPDKLDARLKEVEAAKAAGTIDDPEAEKRKAEIAKFENTFHDRVKQHKATVDQIIQTKLETHKLPPIKTYKDLKIVDDIARRNLDMDDDKADAIINLNVLGGGGIVDTAAPTEVSEIPTFDMDDVEGRFEPDSNPTTDENEK